MNQFHEYEDPQNHNSNFDSFVIGFWIIFFLLCTGNITYFITKNVVDNRIEEHVRYKREGNVTKIKTFNHEGHDYIRFIFNGHDSTVVRDPNCKLCLTKSQ